MATKDTGGGQQKASGTTEEGEEQGQDAQAAEDLKERQEKLSDDVDSVLDEIDDVLEENAEDFVRSFVQKGGGGFYLRIEGGVGGGGRGGRLRPRAGARGESTPCRGGRSRATSPGRMGSRRTAGSARRRTTGSARR